MKHPKVDQELTVAILRRSRHGKNARPDLSGYAEVLTTERAEFAELVLAHCDDRALVNLAITTHSDFWSPGHAVMLAARSLDWPQRLARSVTATVHSHMGASLPPDVDALVAEAGKSAEEGTRASAELAAALETAKRLYPIEGQLSDRSQSPEELVKALAQAPHLRAIEGQLRGWSGDLPWQELADAVEEGRLGRAVRSCLATWPGASPGFVRHVVGSGEASSLYDRVDPRYWLECLLADPVQEGDPYRSARVDLAQRLMPDESDDFRPRMPHGEWALAAHRFLRNGLLCGADDPAERQDLLKVASKWFEDGAIEPSVVAGTLPLALASQFWFAIDPDADAWAVTAPSGDPIPAAFGRWVEAKLREPEREFSEGVIASTLEALHSWEDSFPDLIGSAEELQDQES
ncbi:hypothetical protein N802_05885 [Knoellia sinensis KCTC 19936]|uniref:Uncharacterized protein n=1 Tax=Knoellia sinensis KCTC 19936 TaxID=1385520 RepID=A0A0A0J202_9MICO|nr:hypothetical protein N802_05885 [Knoellia sinensis KCTC 19936]